MSWKFGKTRKKDPENLPEKQEKKERRWNVKSCLSVLLSVTITVTTIHSNVLYAQAEADADPAPVRFRFCPLEQTGYSFDVKGSLEDTISKLPGTLKINIIEENTAPETPAPGEDGTVDPDGSTAEDGSQENDASPEGDGTQEGQNPPSDQDDQDNKDSSSENGSQGNEGSSSENGPQGNEGSPSEDGGMQDGQNPPSDQENNNSSSEDGTAGNENSSPENGSQGSEDSSSRNDSAGSDSSASLSSSTVSLYSPVYLSGGSENPVSFVSSDNSPEDPGNSASGTDPSQGSDNSASGTDPSQDSDNSASGTDPSQGTGNPAPGTDPSQGSGNPAPGTDASQGSDNSASGTDPSQDPNTPAPGTGDSQGDDVTDPTDGAAGSTDNTGDIIADPVPENPDGTDPVDPVIPPVDAPVETVKEGTLNVTWTCDHYEEVRDSYTFTPEWNRAEYNYTGEDKDIPTITVTFTQTPGLYIVSTEKELRDALNALNSLPEDLTDIKIMLENDIALTKTLSAPDLRANTSVCLESLENEGQPFALTRGTASDGGQRLTGPLLVLGSLKNTADTSTYGTLTLANITIDGKKTDAPPALASPDNMSNAPAVISYGNLVLDSGTSILNNYNTGTLLSDGNGIVVTDESGTPRYAIPPYGGGLLAYEGSVTLREGSSIRNNTALSGGGLYLDSNAVLHLYADVLAGNSAVEGGLGADLYAAAGSAVHYYNPAINMYREGFYLDPSVVPVLEGEWDMDTPIEIYLNIADNSGYSLRTVKDKLESTFGNRVKVLLPQTYIDTTDLRNWYVFDHYDTNCWDSTDENGNNIPDSWEQAYAEYLYRPYYPYTPKYTNAAENINDIPSWLESINSVSGTIYLAPFKEHIYSRTENGRPEMTFAGYDRDANVDFLFYDPKSAGEKVVEFDVDSAKVNIHTLDGTGFLVNTGISGGNLLNGYLIYYTYGPETTDSTDENGIITQTPTGNTIAKKVTLYKLNNVNIQSLHSGGGLTAIQRNATVVGTYDIANWNPQMSIKITVNSNEITLSQWPKGSDSNDPAAKTFTWSIDSADHSGFGPLVVYNSHACSLASSFTYSNLRMWFTNPNAETQGLLRPLMEADYSQNVPKKYFLNLLGRSGAEYNQLDMGQYQEFLKLMQQEGIGLITDSATPFDEYLGSGGSSRNLCEFTDLQGTADLDALIANIAGYLPKYDTTKLPDDLAANNLKPAAAGQSIGNIWLKDVSNGAQIERTLNGNTLPENYCIEIMDISYTMDSDKDNISYSLLKPGSPDYIPLGAGNNTGTDAAGPSRSLATGVYLNITHDQTEWPAGQYTVRQQVGSSDLYGYSYFTLRRPTYTPDVPVVVPPAVTTPTEEVSETLSHGSSSGRSGYTPEIRAAEPAAPGVVSTTAPSDGAAQPKTGDNMFPAMPVACGACTAFMIKIMLWMYEMDMTVTRQYKEEVVQSLICWGKGSTKLRIFVTILALAVVITAYHLMKAFSENSKRMVRARLGI